MATGAKIGPQDLPPPGGYAAYQTERVKLRTFVGWKTGIAIFLASTALGSMGYTYTARQRRRELIEMRSARFALSPLLTAERDRAFLKQIRKNRDEEEDLMKDYPGWVVGTYFGEPVYHCVPEDKLIEPTLDEFAVHAPTFGIYFQRLLHPHLT